MSKSIVDVGPKYRKIVDIGRKLPRVDPKLVAKALGADPALSIKLSPGGGPATWFALRSSIYNRLRGKSDSKKFPAPEIKDAFQKWSRDANAATIKLDRSVGSPLHSEYRKKLAELAGAIASEGFKPSPDELLNFFVALGLDAVSNK